MIDVPPPSSPSHAVNIAWLLFCLLREQHLSVTERLHRNMMEKRNRYSLAALRVQCAYRAYKTRVNIRALVELGRKTLLARKEAEVRRCQG